jgi:signal transduction histidine kinase
MIASSRLVVGALVLLIAATDPSDLGFQNEWDDLAASVYFLIGAILTAVAWRSWWFDFQFSKQGLFLDGTIYLALLVFMPSHVSGYLAVTLALAAHLVIGSALRYGWKVAVGVGLGILAMWSVDQYFESSSLGSIDLGMALRRMAFLFATCLISLWATMMTSAGTVPRLRLGESLELHYVIGESFDFARTALGAQSAILCWILPDASVPLVQRSGSTADLPEFLPKDIPFTPSEANSPALIFDLLRGRALSCSDHGIEVSERLLASLKPMLTRLGVVEGLAIPIVAVDRQGWLLVSGFAPLTWSHLPLARGIGLEVSHAITSKIASQVGRENDEMRVRQELANDLHDSVVQSLAGAKFMMTALGSMVSPSDPIAAELQRLRDAFDHEHQHLRWLINRLRYASSNELRANNLISSIKAFLGQLSRQWNVKTTFNAEPTEVLVGNDVVEEIEHVVREAIANAVRHGGADSITVDCRQSQGSVVLGIIDNGRGFGSGPISAPKTIATRVAHLQGKLAIESKVGLTRLDVVFPIGAAH